MFWNLFVASVFKLLFSRPARSVPHGELMTPNSRPAAIKVLLGFLVGCFVVLPLYCLASVLFYLYMVCALVLMVLFGMRGDCDAYGISLHRLAGRRVTRYEWPDVAQVVIRLTPPVSTPTLILKNGARLEMPMADFDKLEAACLAAGVPFSRSRLPSGIPRAGAPALA